MTAPIRRLRHTILACSLVTIAACVHAPAERVSRNAARQPIAVLSDGPGSTNPQPPTPSSQSALPLESAPAADEVTQAADLTPDQYADLFDRMRVGFKLDEAPGQRDIDQQLDWFVANPNYLERSFGRAELYLYHIVTQLEARGMPLEIALLPIVESAFEPYAYSHARAAGLWQFVPGTGARFGLKQNWWYDGRRDIVESTRAALDYLQYLHDEFNGDWLVAIAAYDCGEGTVKRAVANNRAAGKATGFWSLRLPRETRAYVPKLLAMKRLIAAPERFGVALSPIPNQPYFARVATQGQINMKLAAEIAGVTADELYDLNPAFHRWATDPAGPHFLLLPVDRSQVFEQNLAQLSEEQRMGVAHYTVRKGDSVVSVAQRFETSVNVVRDLNGIPEGRLTVGIDLRVPSAVEALPAKVTLAAARVDRPARFRQFAHRVHVQVTRTGDSLWAMARPSGGASAGRRVVYIVRSGDTLNQIARLFQVTVSDILSWNKMSLGAQILKGQKLSIRVASRGG
jgi:membrane-bound lytic murein transglycosylase D